MNKRKKIHLFIVLGIALSICIIVLILFGVLITNLNAGNTDHIAFDADLWRQGETTARQEMVDDLLQNHSPIGLTKQQVVDLLGERSETHHFREYDLVYWIGPEQPFMGDSEWLVIRFDDQGAANEAVVVTD